MTVRFVAFYLPQFYPFPENDEWWGKGFTEWTNVTKAAPLYDGHYQPHLPTDLGFYDLRVRETQRDQISLAKAHGIEAFCFHYYWFSGKRLLDRPVDAFLADRAADMPFCLCWANENWTRRWDAAEQQVLIAQRYEEGWPEAFIDSVAPFLRDERYLRTNGKPLLIVYRPQHIPDVEQASERWRSRCRELGIGEISLVAAMTHGNWDYQQFGFDGGVEFPPHNLAVPSKNEAVATYQDFRGYLVEYGDVARDYLSHNYADKRIYRTVFPSWDNTARVKERALMALGASPANYEKWLHGSARRTMAEREGDDQLVFINAWNEWAEGCHLEPDRQYGRQYLEATRRVHLGQSRADEIFNPSPFPDIRVPEFTAEAVRRDQGLKQRVRVALEKYPIALNMLVSVYRAYRGVVGVPQGMPSLPRALAAVELSHSAPSVTGKTALLAALEDRVMVGLEAQTVALGHATVAVSNGATNGDLLGRLMEEVEYTAEALSFGIYHNSVVDPRAASVVTEHGTIISETSRVYGFIDPNFAAVPYLELASTGGFTQVPAPLARVDEAVLFPLHASFAFGHCMLDAIPQILFWEDEIKHGRVKVGLSALVPSWFQTIMGAWGFEPKHFIVPNGAALVRAAIVSNALSSLSTFAPNPLALQQFHRANDPTERRSAGSRLYLRRGSSGNYSLREIQNEDAIVEALQARGFNILDPSAAPYAVQREAFASAELVVGPHGSAFANLVWCQPGTRVIDLMPDHWIGYWGNPGIPERWLSRLSGALRLKYCVLLCPSTLTTGDGQSAQSIQYTVDLNDLVNLI